MGVVADFGAKVDGRKGAVRLDPDIMKNVSMKWGDKGNWVVIKISDAREETEEVPFYKFFRWYPKLFTAVVNNLVLVRVAINGVGADGGSEEVRKEVD